MQIMPETGEWIAMQLGIADFTSERLFDPDTSIRFASFYLSYLLLRFDEEWQAFAAYNAGEGKVGSWLEEGLNDLYDIPYRETKSYVIKIQKADRYYLRKKISAFD